MTFTLDEAQEHTQGVITDNAVVVIGSGLSAAAGLPTMPQLATLLLDAIPWVDGVKAEWGPVAQRLKEGVDLERALDGVTAGALLDAIISIVAAEVLSREATVLAAMARNEINLPLTALIKQLARVNAGRMVVVTTNYDRLAEAAIEHAGLPVDCGFPGTYFSPFDEAAAKLAFRSPAGPHGRLQTLRQHVVVAKPHGSLDWYHTDAGPVRSVVDIGSARLIITPGSSKYERGYDRPFDYHRESGNRAIQAAGSLLILGYGFNDNHLQTHLEPRLKAGTPALVVARTLSDRAKDLLGQSGGAIGYEQTAGSSNGAASTTVHWRGQQMKVDSDLWDLTHLTSKVLA